MNDQAASLPIEIVALTLERTGLAHEPGRSLYSGIGTLAPGKVYLLGFNPGGDPKAEPESAAAHLAWLRGRPPDWNEYIDGVRFPGGRRMPAGGAPMQRRVQTLLRGIGLPVASVCASNVIFVRSRAAAGLSNLAELTRRCWPVHAAIIEIVQPRAIVCIGGTKGFRLLSERGRLVAAEESFAAGHGKWRCQAAGLQLGSRTVRLIGVPHLSRYAVDAHPGVINWVREQIAVA